MLWVCCVALPCLLSISWMIKVIHVQRVTYSTLMTPRYQRRARMIHIRSTSTDDSKLPTTRPVRLALLLLGLPHTELSPRTYFSSLLWKSENGAPYQTTLRENTHTDVHIHVSGFHTGGWERGDIPPPLA